MKSEPDVFSFDDMVAKTKRGEPEEWHGVRNYAARNNMEMNNNPSPGNKAAAAAAGTLKPIVAALKSSTFIGNVIGWSWIVPQVTRSAIDPPLVC